MVKRGWLGVANPRNVNEVETALTSFFGVECVDDIEILPHAAKKTEVKRGGDTCAVGMALPGALDGI